MTASFKSTQRGISVFCVLLAAIVLACLGVVGVRVFPVLVEYQAVLKAINKAKDGITVAEVRGIFDKAAQVDDIHSISGDDLEITKEGDKVVIGFAYQREVSLAGPVYLLFKYSGRSS